MSPYVSNIWQYKLGVTVHWCLQSTAPHHLVNCCTYPTILPMSPAVSVFTVPATTSSSFYDIVAASSVVGCSLLPARWCGTLCPTI